MLSKIGIYWLFVSLFSLLGISEINKKIIQDWKKEDSELNLKQKPLMLIYHFKNSVASCTFEHSYHLFFDDFKDEDDDKLLESVNSFAPYKEQNSGPSSSSENYDDFENLFLYVLQKPSQIFKKYILDTLAKENSSLEEDISCLHFILAYCEPHLITDFNDLLIYVIQAMMNFVNES
jgi:hypothetical protein